MTGRKQNFVTLDEGKECTITFGNEQSTKIIGRGTVFLNNKNIMAENFYWLRIWNIIYRV